MSPLSTIIQIALVFLISCVAALEVSPSSPCAEFCIDSKDADYSDPNFSSTENKDIVCKDSQYTTTPVGQKFQRCISCLQDSQFVNEPEDDQSWFLYNVRYSFNYCVFGFPNAKNAESTPCLTSTACLPLKSALTGDIIQNTTPDYSFCDANGGVMGSDVVQSCLSCVNALEGQHYLANYLVALEAGCEQRPPPGTQIGLNDTVFSEETIEPTDGVYGQYDDDKGKKTLDNSAIVGIVVGVVALVIIVAAICFVCHKKKQNRKRRWEANNNMAAGMQQQSPGRPMLLRRGSSLSFRCQTHLSPRSPDFPQNQTGVSINAALEGQNTAAAYSDYSPQHYAPPLSKKYGGGHPFQSPIYETSPYHSEKEEQYGLQDIATVEQQPAYPGTVHHYPSPSIGCGGYYGGSDAGTPVTSANTASPLISRGWEQRSVSGGAPTWDQPQPQQYQQQRRGSKIGGLVSAVGKPKRVGSSAGNGSPVDSKKINISFPGPPTGL